LTVVHGISLQTKKTICSVPEWYELYKRIKRVQIPRADSCIASSIELDSTTKPKQISLTDKTIAGASSFGMRELYNESNAPRFHELMVVLQIKYY
jgi:hypothetical protein